MVKSIVLRHNALSFSIDAIANMIPKKKNEMIKQKRIGIWMDHASAKLLEYGQGPVEIQVIHSSLAHHEREEAAGTGEHQMHNKEQHQDADYYKRLGAIMKSYDRVLLFGPTKAKEELFNLLSADHQFAKVKIEVQQTDKMTEGQLRAFVRAFFSKN